jgi:DNA polymerase (family 10)
MIAKKTISEKISNEDIADVLDHIAELLEVQENNVHRVRAYRDGANGVRETPEPLVDMVKDGGHEKLQSIPGIGEGLARLIFTYITTGESNLLNRLQGEVEPEELFAQVPSIGEKLARRISMILISIPLDELEQAAYDGRLLALKVLVRGVSILFK